MVKPKSKTKKKKPRKEIEVDSDQIVSDADVEQSRNKKRVVKKASSGSRPEKKKSKRSSKQIEDVDEEIDAEQLPNEEHLSTKASSGSRPYRSTFSGLSTLANEMKKKNLKLNDEQMDMLRDSPFGYLFIIFLENEYKPSHWDKNDNACTKLLQCFKEGTKDELKFEFVRRGEIHILTSTPEELGMILGMPCLKGRKQENKKAMSGGCFKETEFYRRNFGDAKSASKALIQGAILKLIKGDEMVEKDPCIKKRNNEDLVMLIGLFMCNTLFFTTKDSSAIKEKYLGLVDNFEKCKNLSWAHLIHAHLAKCINKSFRKPTNINGCVIYLLIWYAEHTDIVAPEPLAKDKYVPRAARWNLKKICKAFLGNMDDSNYVFYEKFIEDYTKAEKVVLNGYGIAEQQVPESEKSKVEGKTVPEEQNRSQEGRSTSVEEKYENLRMTIKSRWDEMQKMKTDKEVEIDPNMEQMLNVIYFQAYPDISGRTPPLSHFDSDPWSSMSGENEQFHVSKDNVPLTDEEAPKDVSNTLVQSIGTDSIRAAGPLISREVKVDLGFNTTSYAKVYEDVNLSANSDAIAELGNGTEHLPSDSQLDDTDIVTEKTCCDFLINLQRGHFRNIKAKDGKSKPSPKRMDELALATSHVDLKKSNKRKNTELEVSTAVTRARTRTDRTKKVYPAYTRGDDFSEASF